MPAKKKVTTSSSTLVQKQRAETIDDVFTSLIPNWSRYRTAIKLPPLVYALCATVLSRTGDYVSVIELSYDRKAKSRQVEKVGKSWERAINNGSTVPAIVLSNWQTLRNMRGTKLTEISQNSSLITTLLDLIAFADAACTGIGIPDNVKQLFNSQLLFDGILNLVDSGTLTPQIPSSHCVVLPKQHTPDVGLTLRSLTHNLGLHSGTEVKAAWHWTPFTPSDRMQLDLLLAPWPLRVRPVDFRPSKSAASKFGHGVGEFEYLPLESESVVKWTKQLLWEAVRDYGNIDGIIFPEYALSKTEFEEISAMASRLKKFVVAGVRELTPSGKHVNMVKMKVGDPQSPIEIEQRKHHRWKLNKQQIDNYGLGSVLNPLNTWWEGTHVSERIVNFVCLSPQLTFCCLVCEDLARQDPVAELVRTVGPNLVIAALMDGPQLKGRWPGRYATVLADDPGCSVLTLTSIGMASLSRPPRGVPRSRSIALWKDAISDEVVELELPVGAEGLVLNLYIDTRSEASADGRNDGETASYPRLTGWHAVTPSAPPK